MTRKLDIELLQKLPSQTGEFARLKANGGYIIYKSADSGQWVKEDTTSGGVTLLGVDEFLVKDKKP
ncbi:hypothetical protein [Cohnella sp. AR92]|uniref:hypothetical protein n=1 Tax=Cohnella sp. AR92 TaxID=648716 RepID=UPI000F8EDB5A|nr:hypothetical protein [Cohnella sp. AR92]RUS44962.1 hypothetical protein ELR57_22160 [Cohnella sp. AR92]